MNDKNNIFDYLNQIYSTNGKDKNSWKELIFSLNNFNFNPSIIHYFNQRIINEPSNLLTLDILDFLIDFGPIQLLRELSKIDLMINVFNLLKKSSGSGPEVQKKGIYLTKKWFEIAKNHKGENFEGFIRNYQELKNKGISFPPPGYKLNTYEQYISIYEINKLFSNYNPNKNKFLDINNSNENFLNYNNHNLDKNINNNIFDINNSEITPFEQESKYNKNDDIPSNSMPQLNNYENHSNFKKVNIYKNNMNLHSSNKNIDINDNINNEINNYNIPNKNYFERNEKMKNFDANNNQEMKVKGQENSNPFEDLNKKVKFPENFENKFSDLKYSTFSDKPESIIQNDNVENNKYPKYNEQQIKNNNKYSNDDIETPIGADLYCAPLFNNVISTPMGNKNPIQIPNKHYNTIYNNGFKSYMDVKYGNNNKNNNNINNNFNNGVNNNHYNNNFNNVENDNKFNKPKNNYNIQNYQNQINENKNNIKDMNNPAFLYKHSWSLKIAMYNDWIDKGSNDKNEEQLKIGIRNILFEFNKVESLLQKYNKEGDFESVCIILKLKSDMIQTCYRYERFINNQSYEKFYSAFEGNINSYNFNKEYLLSYIESKDNNNNKYIEGLKKFGGAMKKGIVTAGKVVKENTVKGINFVKEKVHRDKNNEINLNKQNNNANINDYSKSSDFNYNNNNFNNNLNNQINNITPNPINNQSNNFDNYNNNNFNYNYNNFNNNQNNNNNNKNFY